MGIVESRTRALEPDLPLATVFPAPGSGGNGPQKFNDGQHPGAVGPGLADENSLRQRGVGKERGRRFAIRDIFAATLSKAQILSAPSWG